MVCHMGHRCWCISAMPLAATLLVTAGQIGLVAAAELQVVSPAGGPAAAGRCGRCDREPRHPPQPGRGREKRCPARRRSSSRTGRGCNSGGGRTHQKTGQKARAAFVFTGRLDSFTREEAKEKVEVLGGRATSSVSGETDYLVVGEGPGSKLEEAKKQDVEILDEQAFKDLIRE